MMKTILNIEGMSCENCVRHVKEALEALAGVISAEVSLENNTADIEHGEGTSPALLKAAVVEEGYGVN